MQRHTHRLRHLSPPLMPCRRPTNTAACLPPPSHPNNAAVRASRRHCPTNAAARPPLPKLVVVCAHLPPSCCCHWWLGGGGGGRGGSKGGGGGGQSSGKMASRFEIWRPTRKKCTNIYDTVPSQKFTKIFCAPECSNNSVLLARQSHQAPRSITVLVLLLVGIVRVHFLYQNPKMCKYQIFSTDILYSSCRKRYAYQRF